MSDVVKIDPDSELSRQLRQAAEGQELLRVESGGIIYDVQIHRAVAARRDLPYRDPALIRQKLAESFGAFSGVDVDVLKEELREAREQDSFGRPA